MPKWFHFFYELFIELGFRTNHAKVWNAVILFVIASSLLILIDYLIWKTLRFFTTKFARTTKTKFDDFAISHSLPRHLAHIPTISLAFKLFKVVFHDFPQAELVAIRILQIITVVVILRIIRSFLQTINTYLKTLPNYKDKPIDSYIQVFMIFAWLAGFATIMALLTGFKITDVLKGLGAASAVIILVFRDSILGLVASVQVSMNDTVRIGDWITMNNFNADGVVEEISLATVKIKNFDHSLTSVPTYALISDSFTNWRAMQDSNGRRLKRSIYIKQQSVHFLDKEEIEDLKKIELLSTYLANRQEKIDRFNSDREVNTSLHINGRNMTNLGVFRKYLMAYIEDHPAINKELTFMVRYLDPTEHGIPVEIYAFCTDKRWENYEHIAADILDHTIASVPYFGLEIYESVAEKS